MRLVSSFVYLKIRHYESPTQNGSQETPYNHPPTGEFYYGNVVSNPNYEQNVLLDPRGPSGNFDVDRSLSPPPSGKLIANKKHTT